MAVVASGLTAVKPNWFSVIDCDGEARPRRRVFSWNETREEASCEGMAGVCEGRLSDCVILGEEVKLDLSADLSNEVIGIVLKNSICANGNFDSSSNLGVDSSRSGDKAKEGIGKLHYDLFAD